MKGTIKNVNKEKGYGFIRADYSGKELFFHRSGLKCNFDNLSPGIKVTYEETESAKGPRAEGVDLAES